MMADQSLEVLCNHLRFFELHGLLNYMGYQLSVKGKTTKAKEHHNINVHKLTQNMTAIFPQVPGGAQHLPPLLQRRICPAVRLRGLPLYGVLRRDLPVQRQVLFGTVRAGECCDDALQGRVKFIHSLSPLLPIYSKLSRLNPTDDSVIGSRLQEHSLHRTN